MKPLIDLLGVAILLFASTNLDDIFILVGFFADRRYRTREIVAGQFGGISILFATSAAASLLSFVIPLPCVGLLGAAPILIGVKKLWDLFQRQVTREQSIEPHPSALGFGRLASVAAVTVANGADNLAIYTPAFAIRSHSEIDVIALVFAVMTAAWCFFARAVVKHPTLGAPIRHYVPRIVPAVLICLGVLILYQAGSFGLLLRVQSVVSPVHAAR
jgi:cadmium resistance protein CadD (predicted permease)